MRFSKTRFIAGLQCKKQLHLRVHHAELASPTQKPATLTGQVAEAHAHLEFPDGILVERDRTGVNPFSETQRLMTDPSVTTLFEAGILDDNLALFVDVLTRNGNGWVVTEIKASTRIKDAHIDDVTIQALALKRAGITINRFELMHVNNGFVYAGAHDYRGLFVREDITERVMNHIPSIERSLDELLAVADGPLPQRFIGSHCKNPYECPYRHYCAEKDTEYPVGTLPNGYRVAEKMHARGIHDIRDIPIDELSSEIHLRVRRAVIAGNPELLAGAKEALAELVYPRFYLDFECIQFAIPIWEGTKPFSQNPFQWSCHIEHENGELTHHEFLDTSGNNPRRAFAESLLEVCGDNGPIIVYNASFEKRIIRETAAEIPELADRLLALSERVFDLLPVVKQHYYHPMMKGSWSIKAVLPALVPELKYSDLGAVQDGTQAQSVYFALINGETTESEKATSRQDLLDYCRLDTLAMVKIVAAILGYSDVQS
jgi:hypothetical protein